MWNHCFTTIIPKEAVMKRLLVVAAALSVFAAGAAYAGGNTGCGLGTMIFKGTENQSTLIQILAVTTNGTSGNQTFGITSGTLECEQPAKVVQNERLNEFVHANMDELARDIAAGRGETLSTVAELLGVPAAERDAFNGKLQANFHRIFPGPGVEYAHVVDTIVSVSHQG